jgi:hypothetical protein
VYGLIGVNVKYPICALALLNLKEFAPSPELDTIGFLKVPIWIIGSA